METRVRTVTRNNAAWRIDEVDADRDGSAVPPDRSERLPPCGRLGAGSEVRRGVPQDSNKKLTPQRDFGKENGNRVRKNGETGTISIETTVCAEAHRLKPERDLLKKAAAYFARPPSRRSASSTR